MLMVWHRAATATAALHKRKTIARVLLLQVSQAYFVTAQCAKCPELAGSRGSTVLGLWLGANLALVVAGAKQVAVGKLAIN